MVEALGEEGSNGCPGMIAGGRPGRVERACSLAGRADCHVKNLVRLEYADDSDTDYRPLTGSQPRSSQKCLSHGGLLSEGLGEGSGEERVAVGDWSAGPPARAT